MNLMDPEEFRREFEALKTSNPATIREAFERDQEAEDERKLYRVTGNGELKQEDAA